MGFSKYLGSITVPSVTSLKAVQFGTGWMFGLLVLVVVLLFALSLGRSRALLSLLAIYIAFTLQAVFPFFADLQKLVPSISDLPTLRVIVFFVLYIIVLLLLNRSILKSRFNLGESAFVMVVLMAVVQLGLLISIVLNLAPSFYGIETKLPAIIAPYLATQRALFFWELGPLVLMIFSGN